MKACKHYSRKGETYITPSEGHLWNAWRVIYDNYGNIISSSFETGLRAEYLEHLKNNPECRRFIKITKRSVEEELDDIEEEWQALTA
jgi:hypothetical protein